MGFPEGARIPFAIRDRRRGLYPAGKLIRFILLEETL
jgi:hypothetical protein